MGSWNPPGNAASRELKILLFGPRRTGKSSSGNTLLGRGQVFETRGGAASAAASGITAGRHVTAVDAQGWALTEDFVPKEEEAELVRALSLCGPGGPHVVLLVIPLLDFTEPERRAVERRMEILTPAVWRHTMVLFTGGDRLRGRGRSVEEYIESGGPALHSLMEKCCYRYHVFDNKTAAIRKQEGRKQEVNEGAKKQQATWRKKNDKGAGRKSAGGETDGKREGEQEQVRELLRKVENMLQQNGGWHFSLHMYRELEEEWRRREQKVRARLEAETNGGSVRRKQKTAEMKTNVDPEKEQSLETKEEEEEEDSLKSKHRNKEECVERKMNRGEDREEGEKEVKTKMMASCRPNGGQRFPFNTIRRLA